MPLSLVRHRRENGFTMIELLVVVIIIAILAAIAVPVYIGLQTNAKRSAMRHDVDTTRLSVAAAITEDGVVNSGQTTDTVGAQVYNSKSPTDEIVEVSINQDKSYTVTASSASLNFSVKYASTGASNSTATAVGTASAPYCTVASSYSTTPKVATASYDSTIAGVYAATTYYSQFETFANSNWSSTDQTSAQTQLEKFRTAYQTTEAAAHTNTTTDAWATDYKSRLQSNYGWVTYLFNEPNSYMFLAYSSGGSQVQQLVIPKGGSSAVNYIFGGSGSPTASLGNANGTYQYDIYPGYLSVNGATPVKGFYSNSQTTSTSAFYHTFIGYGAANCK